MKKPFEPFDPRKENKSRFFNDDPENKEHSGKFKKWVNENIPRRSAVDSAYPGKGSCPNQHAYGCTERDTRIELEEKLKLAEADIEKLKESNRQLIEGDTRFMDLVNWLFLHPDISCQIPDHYLVGEE